jgi:hypothetical protein
LNHPFAPVRHCPVLFYARTIRVQMKKNHVEGELGMVLN